jgi:hypothetical protein
VQTSRLVALQAAPTDGRLHRTTHIRQLPVRHIAQKVHRHVQVFRMDPVDAPVDVVEAPLHSG